MPFTPLWRVGKQSIVLFSKFRTTGEKGQLGSTKQFFEGYRGLPEMLIVKLGSIYRSSNYNC
jgi:hypothetical protein